MNEGFIEQAFAWRSGLLRTWWFSNLKSYRTRTIEDVFPRCVSLLASFLALLQVVSQPFLFLLYTHVSSFYERNIFQRY